ncbi:response regulator [Microcoleus sp. EPA2]|uniref:response regulator n=1 Tax=Microcoleus sp. EPA2 TaxID=2841654 RepID=UPI00312BA954
MKIPSFSNLFARVAGTLPLRTVLIVPFVIQIVGTVGLVGYLSYKNGQQAVKDLAYQLIDEVDGRVEQNLQNYLDVPKQINQNHAAAIRTRVLDWKNFSDLERYFAQQLQIYATVSNVAIATEQKEFLAVEKSLANDSLVIRVMDKSTDYAFHRYAADRQGKRIKLTKVRHDYDPHNDPPKGRPWYRAAQEAGKAIWLPVVNLSQGVDRPLLTIVNFLPFSDPDGNFQGILASSLYLPQFANFLNSLEVGRTGQVFIIDRLGLLIASSTGETPFKQKLDSDYLKNLKPQEWRLLAQNSRNPLTQASVNFLLTHLKNFPKIEQNQKLEFDFNRARYFLQVNQISDKSELDWLIITVVPEADFMAQIYANTRTTILLCIASLIGSTGIGIITARWVTKPILDLNKVAKNIARGEWHKSIEIERSDELGQLTKTFNLMSGQLKQSFADLQSLNEALAQSESKLNQILEAMPVGVAVHDLTGQIIYVNQMARQLLEIDETLPSAQTEELAATYRIYHAETQQLYPAENLPIVRSLKGEQVRLDDLEIRFSDRIFPAEVYSMPLFDETGQIVGAIAAFADITDRKQAEKFLANYNRTLAAQVTERTAELARTNSQLEQEICDRKQTEIALAAAKEAAEAASLAKSTFLANMSHELRTPLNGIMGYAQILQRSKDSTAKQQQDLQIIYKCSEHLLTLINDILSLSKIEANKLELNPEIFDFAEFLQEVSKIFSLKAQQKLIDFTCINLTQLPLSICADRQRLRQILINFLSNALKFTDKGSVVLKVGLKDSSPDELEIVQHEADSDRHSSGLNHSQKMRFQIEDTGCGISPENVAKIFLPFEQVGDISRQAEGTGLGLAITKNLLSLMGSKICVESKAGVGSKFWFDLKLPVSSDLIPSISLKSTQKVIGYPGQKQKILVIDDHWENRSVMMNLLEPLGFEVVEAADGETGLKKAVEWQPDLIFSDLVMPGMDGLQLIQKLRQLPQFQSTTIIAASASVFNEDRQKCLELGYSDFIAKPIQAVELLDKIQNYLNFSWIYEPASNGSNLTEAVFLAASPQEMVVPPKEELLALYQAAESFYVEDVESEIRRLQQLHPEYSSFVARMLELSEDFEYEKIVKVIDGYLS